VVLWDEAVFRPKASPQPGGRNTAIPNTQAWTTRARAKVVPSLAPWHAAPLPFPGLCAMRFITMHSAPAPSAPPTAGYPQDRQTHSDPDRYGILDLRRYSDHAKVTMPLMSAEAQQGRRNRLQLYRGSHCQGEEEPIPTPHRHGSSQSEPSHQRIPSLGSLTQLQRDGWTATNAHSIHRWDQQPKRLHWLETSTSRSARLMTWGRPYGHRPGQSPRQRREPRAKGVQARYLSRSRHTQAQATPRHLAARPKERRLSRHASSKAKHKGYAPGRHTHTWQPPHPGLYACWLSHREVTGLASLS